jgi:hypothetical protein
MLQRDALEDPPPPLWLNGLDGAGRAALRRARQIYCLTAERGNFRKFSSSRQNSPKIHRFVLSCYTLSCSSGAESCDQ